MRYCSQHQKEYFADCPDCAARSRALKRAEDTAQERGMVIISVLLNFVDWLDRETTLSVGPEKWRGALVKDFLASHSEGESYFLQAEDIAARLSVPFHASDLSEAEMVEFTKSKPTETYHARTLKLETVQFALARGYVARYGNARARKHFAFRYLGRGSPDVDVSWFDNNRASVSVGDTTTDDNHALQILKKYW